MCFSLALIQWLFILCIVAIAIIGILKLIIPFALTKMGAELGEGMAVLMGVFKIAFWAVIAILVVIIAFAVISCLWSYVGAMPHLR